MKCVKPFISVVMSSDSSCSKMFDNVSVSELRVYVREHSDSVNGYAKPALVKIAVAVQKMMLPIDVNVEKVNDDQHFVIHDMENSSPFTSLHNLVNNFILRHSDCTTCSIISFSIQPITISKVWQHTNRLKNIVYFKTAMFNRF